MPKIQISSFLTFVLQRFAHPSEKKLAQLSQENRRLHNFFHSPLSTVELGRIKIKQGHYHQALTIFEQCIERNDKNEWAWHGKGDAHQFLGQYKNAEIAYTRATKLAPNHALHWGGLANALFGLGRTTEATKIWEKTQKIDPTLGWMRPN